MACSSKPGKNRALESKVMESKVLELPVYGDYSPEVDNISKYGFYILKNILHFF
jgi:hypothetical protein